MTNSIGTLTIDGVLMMCNCSSYLVKADNLGNADKTLVTGPAFLGGTLKVAPTTWIGSRTTYTIMSAAGGVDGAFDATSVTRPGWARIVDWDRRRRRCAPDARPRQPCIGAADRRDVQSESGRQCDRTQRSEAVARPARNSSR